jgi:exopolysaccharide production protein ExoZ
MKQSRLLSIQFARGIAALLVTLYHGSRMVAPPQYAGHDGFGGALSFGHAGVEFFFVLSGFIIYFVHHSDLGQPRQLPRYAWRRASRIYPSYWLVTAFVLASLVIKPDPSLTLGHLFRSILLLPDITDPILGVGWTLVIEVLFYCGFALAILNLRLGMAAAILWIIAILCGLGEWAREPALQRIGSYRCLEFVIGIAAAHMVLHIRVPAPRLVLYIGALGFLLTGLAENAGLFPWDSMQGNLTFGLWSGVMIAGMASAERQGALKVGRAGEFFGGTSYILYLVHTITLAYTYHALQLAGLIGGIPGWIAVLLGSVVSMTAAGLLYRYFEQPVLTALHHFGQARPLPRIQHT